MSEIDPRKFQVTEGVESTWHYHLSTTGGYGYVRSLCGRRTMQTCIPVARWGARPHHIPESWCERCATLAREHASSTEPKRGKIGRGKSTR